jgi:hypothetical protein
MLPQPLLHPTQHWKLWRLTFPRSYRSPIFWKVSTMTVSSSLSLVWQTSPLALPCTDRTERMMMSLWVQRYLLDVSGDWVGGEYRLRSDWE